MTGHIRRRGERSWELKFDVGATGKRRVRYASFKGTKKQAQIELARLVSEHAAGQGVDPNTITVAAFLDRWLRDWATINLTPLTCRRYGQLIEHQINPRIGAMAIQKLRPVNLSELYAALLREGGHAGGQLSPKSVGAAHRVLHRALGHAMEWGVIAANPASVARPPKLHDVEIEIIREADIRAVLDLVDNGRDLRTIASFALATGMRRGEILALRWLDLDLDKATVRVERALEQTGPVLRYKAPKTRAGRRQITLPASAVADLKTYRREQQERRLALGIGKAPDDGLVFPATDLTSPRKPNTFSSDWVQAMQAIGQRISFHSLRHTHASSLIAAGVDVLTVSRRLGHAKPSITLNVYGHLYGTTDDKAAQAIDAMFARVFGGKSVVTDR